MEPVLVSRREQHYVGIRRQVHRQDPGFFFLPLIEDVLVWLAQRGLTPVGAPFLRYLVVDPEHVREVDIGIPVTERMEDEGQIVTGTLSAGTYAMLLYTGHPAEIEEAAASLVAWAEEKSIRWKMDGSRWEGRVEWYYSNLGIEPDMTKWETELAFLTEES